MRLLSSKETAYILQL